ncbi:MAG TPA: CoA transferase, partial [Dehalococcoidia bacterium]|nr:CoA transferase [Dehalococcoidia bacterium]
SEEEWRAFCAAIERPELAEDPRFATNAERVRRRDELAALLAPLFRAKPQFYWMMRFTSANVPCGYPLRFDALRHHQQAVENEYLLEVETSAWGKVWTGGPPWHFSRTPASWRGTPMPGEHTGEVLDELERRPQPAPAMRQA